MSETITLSIPHSLSETEVKSRLASGIADARVRYPEILQNAQEWWTNDRMEFRITLIGQPITGRIDVRPGMLDLSVDLPWMLRKLASRIRPQLEVEGRKMLGGT